MFSDIVIKPISTARKGAKRGCMIVLQRLRRPVERSRGV